MNDPSLLLGQSDSGPITAHVERDGDGWAWYVTYATRCLQAGWTHEKVNAELAARYARQGWEVAWRGDMTQLDSQSEQRASEWPPRPYVRDEDNARYARAVESCSICRPGRMCSLHYGQMVGWG